MDNCGTFQVPGNWVITEQEGYLYLSDLPLEAENAQVYLVQQTYEEVSFGQRGKSRMGGVSAQRRSL